MKGISNPIALFVMASYAMCPSILYSALLLICNFIADIPSNQIN